MAALQKKTSTEMILRSTTAWRQGGRKVKEGAQARDWWKTYVGRQGKRVDYPVFAFEDTEPIQCRTSLPPQEIDLLAAVWVVNRRAKRCRDLARNNYSIRRRGAASNFAYEKSHCYRLKGQALYYLCHQGRLRSIGYHAFRQPDNSLLWAEVLEGEGYRFHAPCPAPNGILPENILEEIEAKPRGAKEPRLKDALYRLQRFLQDKPEAPVYCWPERPRPKRRKRKRAFQETEDVDWADEEDRDF